jgi:hypothetical protein
MIVDVQPHCGEKTQAHKLWKSIKEKKKLSTVSEFYTKLRE